MKISTFLDALFICCCSPLAHADQCEVVDPYFSHDAKKVAYVVGLFTPEKDDPTSFTVTSAELWTASTDGSNARRLTSGSIDGNARWSPDGKQIAFLRKGEVLIINADGTGLKPITKTPRANESSPEFSNDGRVLFFVRSEHINASENLPGREPFWIDGPGQVIAYSLVSGEERKRFESQDDERAVEGILWLQRKARAINNVNQR